MPYFTVFKMRLRMKKIIFAYQYAVSNDISQDSPQTSSTRALQLSKVKDESCFDILFKRASSSVYKARGYTVTPFVSGSR
jgi:hypothetical protein